DGLYEYRFRASGRLIRVLVLGSELADRTWFVTAGSEEYVICGPQYVGAVSAAGGNLNVVIEQGLPQSPVSSLPPAESEFEAFGTASRPLTSHGAPTSYVSSASSFEPPSLADWSYRSGAGEAAPRYFTGGWKFSVQPMPMGADGDTSAYAWYRALIRVSKPGRYTLNFSDAGDWLDLFVNGRWAASSPVRRRFRRPIPCSLTASFAGGENTVAVLAAHYGRDKLVGYLGPVNSIDSKGISGPVHLSTRPDSHISLTKWRMRFEPRGVRSAPGYSRTALDTTGPGWQDAATGEDIFHGKTGFAWYRAIISAPQGAGHLLRFESIDDNAWIYLNGKMLAAHEGWNSSFDVRLDRAWKPIGSNALAILVQNTGGAGGIMGAVDLNTTGTGAETPVIGWKMHGGLGQIDPAGAQWHPLPSRPIQSVPAFYGADFLWKPLADGFHPILRFVPQDLSQGFVWLNRHCLGRYPEKTPVGGMYLPECWIREGSNRLIVYDEEGRSPARTHLALESPASRVERRIELSP
ncbi:MAG TPA: hypothetical protein VGS41_19000, partial [Chthonomonadales bacterium]|nr:hypothetical protein [Chthonomonadales bacterium]